MKGEELNGGRGLLAVNVEDQVSWGILWNRLK